MQNKSASDRLQEAWSPLPHHPPDSAWHALLFRMRLFFDLEVCTIHRDLRKAFEKAAGRVLEVGCGLQPYRHLLPSRVEYHALDWEGSEAHFAYRTHGVRYYDGSRFPFEDGVFDLVFHTEVLEHVYRLGPFVSECWRVLTNDGRMIFTVPFAARNHYVPHDYWRLTPTSITGLLQEAGFTDMVVVPRGGDIAVAVHKVNSVCYRIMLRAVPQKFVRMVNRLFFALLFAAPVVLLTSIGHLSILLKLGSSDDPLGYTVYCRKAASRAPHS